MSQLPTLPLEPAHVIRQFARRAPLDKAQFLYGEIAQRMLGRLSYIRLAPQTVLDAGSGASHALEPLRARYGNIDYTAVDSCAALVEHARQRHATRPSLWQKLRNKPTYAPQFIVADMADTGLPAQSQDFIWSNMALHWHHQPHQVLSEWHRLLKVEGLVMFSSLGPGSFKELREAIQTAGLRTVTPQFVDMHDFGDLLAQRGFAEPVMDQEIITLTYRSAEKLLDDLRNLGGNPSTERAPGLMGRRQHQRLLAALEQQRGLDGTIHLTVEVAYGHAWRTAARLLPSSSDQISAGVVRRKRPQ